MKLFCYCIVQRTFLQKNADKSNYIITKLFYIDIKFCTFYDTKLLKGFVGASDGASSAAFLIELARALKDQPREFTYEFVWFDGEEAVVSWVPGVDSTYGSRYYVQAAKRVPTAINTIKAMILIDMIGDKNLTLRREQNSTPWLKDAIWGAAKRLGHGAVFMDEETPIEDDHLEFAKEGIPTVDIIDLDYPEWHNDAKCCDDLKYGPNANMVEFDFDVTRAVASIVVNGVMFRYPNIRWITVHSGGTVPMLAGRMKDRVPAGAEKYLPNGLYAELRKWYYDIAHASFPWPMAAMRSFMPESQILFGTDYAPEPIESTVNELPGLKLPRAFEQMMLRGNAERLFPRFAIATR